MSIPLSWSELASVFLRSKTRNPTAICYPNCERADKKANKDRPFPFYLVEACSNDVPQITKLSRNVIVG